MKILHSSTAILILLFCPASSSAAEQNSPKGEGVRGGERGEHHRRFVARFDEDGDGKVSKVEREKARKVMARRRAKMQKDLKKVRQRLMQQFDADKDGKISKAEREEAKVAIQQRMAEIKSDLIASYDEDGDGKLSKKERRKAHMSEKGKMLELFDEDQNGKLTGEERKKLFEHMLENRPYHLMHQLMQKKRHHPKRGPRHEGGRPAHPPRGNGD